LKIVVSYLKYSKRSRQRSPSPTHSNKEKESKKTHSETTDTKEQQKKQPSDKEIAEALGIDPNSEEALLAKMGIPLSFDSTKVHIKMINNNIH
jgi:DNA-directed RNA polymerase specialized sigma subunit